MNKLLQSRHIIRENLIVLIGLCLCFYFYYHMVQGERSLTRLLALGHTIETTSLEYDTMRQEREALDKKVSMMRPGSIDRDLLSERVRFVLGYRHKDEVLIMRN